MRYRRLVGFGALAAVASVAMAGQAPQTAGSTAVQVTPWTPARTAWGDPDLQGLWRNGMSGPPLERPEELAGRAFLTDAEVAARTERAEKGRAQSEAGVTEFPGARQFPTFQNIALFDPPRGPIRVARRTSAIVDPPNGRLPPWTPEQVTRFEARTAARAHRGEADSREDRGWPERCLPVVGPAVVSTLRYIDPFQGSSIAGGGGSGYNPVRRILQVPGYVVMVLGNDVQHRIIPVDGRPGLSPKIRQWVGEARGHWEGNTLVVETTNINDQQDGGRLLPSHEVGMYPGSGETLRVIERFTWVDADTIEYGYTIDDPEVYTQPYTVRGELTREPGTG